MLASLPFILALALGDPAPAVQSLCHQVAPSALEEKWVRSDNQTRAVLMIHGFHYHFRSSSVARAEFRPWQKPDAALVKEMGKCADVFVLAYGQNATIDTIVKESKLADSVAQLRKLGYGEIVLLGHSAGGLIARHFVEDNPDAGVTKVVQVCAPNGGTTLANLAGPSSQRVFLDCLTEEHRQQCLKQRANKTIPDKIQFVCVVARGDGTSDSDGIVLCRNQWTADLQKQGIPALAVTGAHREVVRDAKSAETLARLIREDQRRWDAERIDMARQEILGKK